jgi:hypothetical protein
MSDMVESLRGGLRETFPPLTEPQLAPTIEQMTEAARLAISDPIQDPEDRSMRGRGRTHDLVMSIPNDGKTHHVVVHSDAFKRQFLHTVASKRGSWFCSRLVLHSLVDVSLGRLRGIDRSLIHWDHEAERRARLTAPR